MANPVIQPPISYTEFMLGACIPYAGLVYSMIQLDTSLLPLHTHGNLSFRQVDLLTQEVKTYASMGMINALLSLAFIVSRIASLFSSPFSLMGTCAVGILALGGANALAGLVVCANNSIKAETIRKRALVAAPANLI